MPTIEWQDDGPTPAPVNVITELIVLIVSRSELEIGEKTLRGLVRGAFREMVGETGLELASLRGALEGHTRYDASKAEPVFYRLKSLQEVIGMDVILPDDLDADYLEVLERAKSIE
ncbi:MAG: hypothetical protein KJO07_11895, partial [Deltaproteobacteria bacterium]|nr:hypothetical protein [Deltaproteobacteria bacterium]